MIPERCPLFSEASLRVPPLLRSSRVHNNSRVPERLAYGRTECQPLQGPVPPLALPREPLLSSMSRVSRQTLALTFLTLYAQNL